MVLGRKAAAMGLCQLSSNRQTQAGSPLGTTTRPVSAVKAFEDMWSESSGIPGPLSCMLSCTICAPSCLVCDWMSTSILPPCGVYLNPFESRLPSICSTRNVSKESVVIFFGQLKLIAIWRAAACGRKRSSTCYTNAGKSTGLTSKAN